MADNSRFLPEPVILGQMIQNITTQIYPKIQSRRQQLSVEISDILPPVRADRQYLEQILRTLLANASKFTPEEGSITVSAYREGRNMTKQVSDTGIGIPDGEQEQIFQPYYQVNRGQGNREGDTSEETRHIGSGLGLGLAIAKFLVELHGGQIWLESKLGQGSSFFFSLPMAVSIESSSN